MRTKKHVAKRFFLSRFFLLLVLLLLELIVLFLPHYIFIKNGVYYGVATIINIIFIVYIINSGKNPHYKLAWITLIAITPGVGSIIYLLFADKKMPKNLRNEFVKNSIQAQGLIKQKQEYVDNLKDIDVKQQLNYVANNSYYPYYQNSKVTYYDLGEKLYADLIQDIKKARKFIFLEFFIVKDGKLLEELLDVLAKKVQQGVEVDFMYDDAGTVASEPSNFVERLKSLGIYVTVFSPLSPFLVLTARSNIRDHRKICVIDNKIAYTGGINVADEYANVVEVFGHWKDTGVKIEGEAVSSFTVSFIQFFNVYSKRHLIYDDYMLNNSKIKSSGYVLPFSDSPADKEAISRTVHYNIISKAKKYIYIQTPYLIIDDVIQNALCVASKNGVEVIITVPHIPDKKTVFMVTRSNYYKLLKAGVRIFEYTPGFVHSKLCISDDKIAVEGTINMDFRSYYLNYEFGTLIALDPALEEMKKDYLDTLEKSQEITFLEVKKAPIIVRLARAIMNVFAPLL